MTSPIVAAISGLGEFADITAKAAEALMQHGQVDAQLIETLAREGVTLDVRVRGVREDSRALICDLEVRTASTDDVDFDFERECREAQQGGFYCMECGGSERLCVGPDDYEPCTAPNCRRGFSYGRPRYYRPRSTYKRPREEEKPLEGAAQEEIRAPKMRRSGASDDKVATGQEGPPAFEGCPTILTDDEIAAAHRATCAATEAGLGVEWICMQENGKGCRRRSHFMCTTCPGCGQPGPKPIVRNGAWGLGGRIRDCTSDVSDDKVEE